MEGGGKRSGRGGGGGFREQFSAGATEAKRERPEAGGLPFQSRNMPESGETAPEQLTAWREAMQTRPKLLKRATEAFTPP